MGRRIDKKEKARSNLSSTSYDTHVAVGLLGQTDVRRGHSFAYRLLLVWASYEGSEKVHFPFLASVQNA